MKLFSNLDGRDRKMLTVTLSITLLVIVITAVFIGDESNSDDPVPSTYRKSRHGAHAAYDLLQADGYHIQRWEESIGLLAQQVNGNSVVILADPQLRNLDDLKAIGTLLRHGARVFATGYSGGVLLPNNAVTPLQRLGTECTLTAQGLDPLAGSGAVTMEARATWQLGDPRFRVDYYCDNDPAVVEYDDGGGHVVWWSDSSPLENASIISSDNLSLFLNSLGPREGHDFYWDESLHGESHSEWFYARGPALNLILFGLAGISFMVVFSFSRRSGPLREVPEPTRATPMEFLDALGSLYRKAGAASTALSLAYDNFRRRMGSLCGRKGSLIGADELEHLLRTRFPQTPPEIGDDLATCEHEIGDDQLGPKRALALIQRLDQYRDMFERLVRKGSEKGKD